MIRRDVGGGGLTGQHRPPNRHQPDADLDLALRTVAVPNDPGKAVGEALVLHRNQEGYVRSWVTTV